ncbi:MAG: hypothetical protein FWH27_12880 [Planctomycetaceae bacterium]|nr:hypothetical protein [Planctomycetaceae bacterium]
MVQALVVIDVTTLLPHIMQTTAGNVSDRFKSVVLRKPVVYAPRCYWETAF